MTDMARNGEHTGGTPTHVYVTALLSVVLVLGLTVAGWYFIGPDHIVYAVIVQGGFTFLGLFLGPLLVDTVRRRYVVAAREPRIYAVLGADALRRFLGRVGWNRAIDSMREQEPGRTRLERQVRGTELSETGHAVGGIATVLLAMAAAIANHLVGAGQILLIGILVHAYPIMIQRIVRNRILRHSRR